MLPASMQKALDMLDDIGRGLDKIESGEKLPLWLRQASEKSAGASPAFPSMIPGQSLSKAGLGLPGGPGAGALHAVDPAAVLAGLLSDPVLGDYVRRKMNEASF
jgi:hypothetical protein